MHIQLYKIISLRIFSMNWHFRNFITDLICCVPISIFNQTILIVHPRVERHNYSFNDVTAELSTGRMDPRVGSDIGSRFCRILAGRVSTSDFSVFTDYFLVPESMWILEYYIRIDWFSTIFNIIIIIIHSFRRAQCQTSELLRTVIRIWGARSQVANRDWWKDKF